MMKLTVLVDNNTLIDKYFYGEPGVSYFIQVNDKNILFDVGYSDVFIKNARKMNINLLDTDFVVLSHGHLDHTWGLAPLAQLYTEGALAALRVKKPAFFAHPFALNTKLIDDVPESGSIFSEEKLSRFFDIRLTKDPLWLTEQLVFLGEIERKNNFEAKSPMGKFTAGEIEQDDFLTDDSALVYKSSEGLVIITGCSHSGICNITEYAQKVCNDNRVIDIIGGFHLLNPSEEQLTGTLKYMKTLQPGKLHACHCTDLPSKIALSKVTNIGEVGVGMVLEYPH